MKNKLLIIFLVFLAVSCKTTQQPTEQTKEVKTKTITELVRDTIVTVKADSSFYKAWIDCVNDKPIIVNKPVINANKKAGTYLEVPKVTLKKGVLQVDCEAKAQELFLRWKEKHIKEQKGVVKIITLPPELIPRPLTWWQKLWIGLGKVLAAGIIIFGLTKVSWKSLLRLVGL